MNLSIQSILRKFFNWKEKFLHHATLDEIMLLKNTILFNKMDDASFQKMIRELRHIKYPPDELIFREGTAGDSLYVISEGSVRVYTLDANGDKIALARLNKGDYFGEQALLGQAYKTRNANIESITETVLIQIHEKYFNYILQNNINLKTDLKKAGYQQALNILSSSTGFYSSLEHIFANINNPTILELTKDELIFNVGDKADNVYIILDGEIRLEIPNKNNNQFTQVILHKGHLFGELGVLQNKPRAATAVSHGNTHLWVIEGNDFKKYAEQSPQLKQILSSLQQAYRIPLKGVVEQYTGFVKEMGATLTNIYKMDDGRSIVSSNFIHKNIFIMSSTPNEIGKHYQYVHGQNSIDLVVHDNHIISIKAVGMCDDLPTLCHFLLENILIDDISLEHFQKVGQFQITTSTASGKDEIICECMSVTRHQLQKLIDSGIKDLATLSKMTGAATSCRGCSYQILEMVGENPWLTAIIKRSAIHNSYINSYHVIPTNSQFSAFKPGQYIIIQLKVGNHWVERPYSISDVGSNNELRITLKQEPKGLFTQWLFENVTENGLTINTMQPQGSFFLDTNEKKSVVCIAGGIGITPFITFAKTLFSTNNKKRLHVLYFAPKSDDFIFEQEFKDITDNMPSISIQYRTTREQGPLTEEEIIQSVKELNESEVYICGPEGFVQKVRQTLLNQNYDVNKILFEEFVHAGVAKHDAI